MLHGTKREEKKGLWGSLFSWWPFGKKEEEQKEVEKVEAHTFKKPEKPKRSHRKGEANQTKKNHSSKKKEHHNKEEDAPRQGTRTSSRKKTGHAAVDDERPEPEKKVKRKKRTQTPAIVVTPAPTVKDMKVDPAAGTGLDEEVVFKQPEAGIFLQQEAEQAEQSSYRQEAEQSKREKEAELLEHEEQVEQATPSSGDELTQRAKIVVAKLDVPPSETIDGLRRHDSGLDIAKTIFDHTTKGTVVLTSIGNDSVGLHGRLAPSHHRALVPGDEHQSTHWGVTTLKEEVAMMDDAQEAQDPQAAAAEQGDEQKEGSKEKMRV